MDREVYSRFRILEARILQLEGNLQDISQYVSDMDANFKDANTELSRQINVALRETEAKIKDLENCGQPKV